MTTIAFNETLRQKYLNLWASAEINPKYKNIIELVLTKIKSNKNIYLNVELITKCPWQIVAVIHYMEAGLNFKCHLHNGDTLETRTTSIPEGRPPFKEGPFTWVESACDAILFDKMSVVKLDNIPFLLFKLEMYNGSGYLRRGINSPYLWSFTNHYGTSPHIGKYVDDGVLDPNAISKQIGCVPLLKGLIR